MNKTIERALLARPLLLLVGAAAAVWLVPNLRGALILWIAGIFAGSTLLLWGMARLSALASFARRISPVVGLLGWGVLATFTGGLKSPFVAAFYFEIALSVVSMSPRGVAWVTANAVAILFAIQYVYGLSEGLPLLLLEAGFALAIGALGAAVARRRRTSELALRRQGEELGGRLESLQRALEDERTISRVGENVARLAHGLKNAVHSLRGFVSLIEPQLEGRAGARAALTGLRAAIDDLERLARLTLAEGADASEGPGAAGASGSRVEETPVAAVVADARDELTSASPGVSWSVTADDRAGALAVAVAQETLLELLIILMRNAVEAMEGRGRARLAYGERDGFVWIEVADEGKGFDPADLSKIFQPGYTTKAGGSGFGLFLARRIASDHGGRLAIEPGATHGAVVRVELPVVRRDVADGPGSGGAVPDRSAVSSAEI